jgi:hypothetical protein
MVQKGDYLETLFRPGDCAAVSRKLLKYLKNINGGGGGSRTLAPKTIFPINSNCYVNWYIFRGLLGDLLSKIETIFARNES